MIEHVDDPLHFLCEALKPLRPGGKIIITMPNREKLFLDNFEPLDYPPHHMTRWSSKQWIFLAKYLDLKLLGYAMNPVLKMM